MDFLPNVDDLYSAPKAEEGERHTIRPVPQRSQLRRFELYYPGLNGAQAFLKGHASEVLAKFAVTEQDQVDTSLPSEMIENTQQSTSDLEEIISTVLISTQQSPQEHQASISRTEEIVEAQKSIQVLSELFQAIALNFSSHKALESFLDLRAEPEISIRDQLELIRTRLFPIKPGWNLKKIGELTGLSLGNLFTKYGPPEIQGMQSSIRNQDGFSTFCNAMRDHYLTDVLTLYLPNLHEAIACSEIGHSIKCIDLMRQYGYKDTPILGYEFGPPTTWDAKVERKGGYGAKHYVSVVPPLEIMELRLKGAIPAFPLVHKSFIEVAKDHGYITFRDLRILLGLSREGSYISELRNIIFSNPQGADMAVMTREGYVFYNKITVLKILESL